ncbi:MAG: glycosyltransferase family 4 protein [Candidatus Aminicenantes bacterium]
MKYHKPELANLERETVFVLLEDLSSPSGGNHYNHFLLQALKKEGLVFQTLNFDQALSHSQRNIPSVYWLDSLYLDRLEDFLGKKGPEQDVFLVIHDLPSFEPDLDSKEARAQKAKEKVILEAVTGFLLTSPLTKKMLEQRKITSQPVFDVPPALCLLPSGKKSPGHGFKGLMVSNLIKSKGILEFLENLIKRISESDQFEVQIVGRSDIEPDYAQACVRTAQKNLLSKNRVLLRGSLSLSELKSLYEKSTVFISASKMETYGMSVQEAVAFGLPVLAYKAPYTKFHMVPGRNGLLYESIPDLVQGCVELIREPQKLIKLEKTARESTQKSKYSWKQAARLFLEQFLAWETHHHA